MVGLALGAGVLLFVIAPRLAGSKRGILSFNAIAEFDSARDYSEHVATKTLADCVREKRQHAWDLARICRRKYECLLWGCWIAGAGAILALFYLLIAR